MGTEIRAEQRQAILAILVSLVACVAVSSDNLIFGHLTGLRLERPPTVRRWQALVVLCVTALSAWGLVFRMRSRLSGGLRHLLRNPILAGLLFGPWRGLLPASKGAREK
ncbi:MAG: hypothetical protein JOZ62_24430 [Acidobacteriaceae bacterium]|nr:hypothetical protein [Acidobacteriaceae bacterium]